MAIPIHVGVRNKSIAYPFLFLADFRPFRLAFGGGGVWSNTRSVPSTSSGSFSFVERVATYVRLPPLYMSPYGAPKDRVRHIFLKLDRATAHIHDLERQIAATARTKPYTVRVKRDTDNGVMVGRLVFVKSTLGWNPDPSLSVLAGEALYHLRSALDQAICHLIVSNRRTNKITTKTQFPIFKLPSRFNTDSGRQIDGIPKPIAKIIEWYQPYNRSPGRPEDDALWTLHTLNNTDKHRRLSAMVSGISVVRIRDSRGVIGTIQSPDITVKHNKVFFTFPLPTDAYDQIKADLSLAIAFKEAMAPAALTLSMDSVLWGIVGRVGEILNSFGLKRP